jgi:hypothetical protein
MLYSHPERSRRVKPNHASTPLSMTGSLVVRPACNAVLLQHVHHLFACMGKGVSRSGFVNVEHFSNYVQRYSISSVHVQHLPFALRQHAFHTHQPVEVEMMMLGSAV